MSYFAAVEPFGSRTALGSEYKNQAITDVGTTSVTSITPATVAGCTLSGGSYYNVSVIANNHLGPMSPWNSGHQTPGGTNNAFVLVIPQPSGADGGWFYDIFADEGSDTNQDPPNTRWIGRITEAQRAAGFVINGNPPAAGGAPVTGATGGTAGTVTVGASGYTSGPTMGSLPWSSLTGIDITIPTSVNTQNKSEVRIFVELTPRTPQYGDPRTPLQCILVPFEQNTLDTQRWLAGSPYIVSALTGIGQPLYQVFSYPCHGATAFKLAVQQLTSGWNLDIYLELV